MKMCMKKRGAPGGNFEESLANLKPPRQLPQTAEGEIQELKQRIPHTPSGWALFDRWKVP
eukprot:1450674-Rhodomonas_salina.1